MSFTGSIRPPFTVPPEDFSLWNDSFELDFNKWKSKDINSKSDKEDYRQYIINLNTDYNVEEAYDKIEAGLEAFETLITCTQKFTYFNLDDDLDSAYPKEDFAIVKDFVKWGFNFVKSYHNDESSKSSENIENGVATESRESEDTNVELSQFDNECQDSLATPVEAEQETGTKKRRKKQRRKKERRQERLLKFHEKLVKTSGLPPSRLMEERLRKPLSDLDKVKRRLASEFEHLGNAEASPTSVPEPGTVPTHHATVPAPVVMPRQSPPQPVPPPVPVLGACQMPASALMPGQTGPNPGNIQPVPQTVTTSGFSNLSTLCSSPVTLAPPSTTLYMWGGNQSPSSLDLCYGSNSGFLNQTSLPSSHQSSVGWNLPVYHQPQYVPLIQPQPVTQPQPVPLPQPQPVPLGGRPSYCFHCLQFGAVYSINPVC
jgi:hypothetical protein